MVVSSLVDTTLSQRPRSARVVDSSLRPVSLADHRSAGQGGDVLQHGLAPVAKSGRLDGQHGEHPPQLVQHQRGQCLAVHVLGNDQQVPLAGLDQFLQQRHNIIRRADFLLVDQHVGLFNHGFHGFRVGHEVGGNVATIELHTLNILGLKGQSLALLDRDHAVLADFVHHFRDQLADLAVLGRDRRHAGDFFLGIDVNRHVPDRARHSRRRLLDAALEQHGVGSGCHVLQSLIHQHVGQHRGCGRAVTRRCRWS